MLKKRRARCQLQIENRAGGKVSLRSGMNARGALRPRRANGALRGREPKRAREDDAVAIVAECYVRPFGATCGLRAARSEFSRCSPLLAQRSQTALSRKVTRAPSCRAQFSITCMTIRSSDFLACGVSKPS